MALICYSDKAIVYEVQTILGWCDDGGLHTRTWEAAVNQNHDSSYFSNVFTLLIGNAV